MLKVKHLAPNQTVIIDTDNMVEWFQSYDTMIARVGGGVIQLDRDAYNYSVTTAKWRNRFLDMTSKEVNQAIKSGRIELVSLNK